MKLDRLKSLDGPILVTGHTGFKGSWLMLLLEELNIPAVGVSLPPEENSLYTRAGIKGRATEYFQDLRNASEVRRIFREVAPIAVIHLAAKSLVLDSYMHPHETFTTNVTGTINILDAARISTCTKVVGVVTTDKVYENSENKEYFNEVDKISGNEPYSSSKAAAEMVVLGWQQLFQHFGGMYPVSLRAGNVIGGGDFSSNRLLPDIVKALESKNRVELRNPSSVRPWQHVLDPLYGYLLALEWTLAGNRINAFNFGPSGENLRVNEVVEIARNAWPTSSKGVDIHYVESEFYESHYLTLDSNRAQINLGWKSQFSQTEAIDSTISWWNKHLLEDKPAINLCLEEIHSYLRKV